MAQTAITHEFSVGMRETMLDGLMRELETTKKVFAAMTPNPNTALILTRAPRGTSRGTSRIPTYSSSTALPT
jgi:hypothetical protein